MDDAARARDAAREALADIEPSRLRDTLYARLDDASMTPAVLALLCARALDPGVDTDAITERAAGVQLIYEGLRLTRTLAHDEPWLTASDEEDIDADIDILAADVLVSRGFYLLARTDAASDAVGTVRTFGRDQTRRREQGADVDALDRGLESSVLALAVVAGSTAVDVDPPQSLLDHVGTLARQFGTDLPPATIALAETTPEGLASMVDPVEGADRVTHSATDS